MPQELHHLAAALSGSAVTARYGSFVFDPATTLTEDFEVKAERDAAGRTVKFSTGTITLRTWILGSPTDDTVRAAVAELNKSGQPFRYHGRGFGDLDINTSLAGTRDVTWGPWPEVVGLKGDFGKRVVRLRWSVSFTIPTCADGRSGAGEVIERAFKVVYNIDKYGLTRRTVSGFLRVAATRIGPDNPNLPVTADTDENRALLTPPGIPGFARTPGEWTLSEDRARIDVSGLADEQMGRNIPPPGVVNARLESTVENLPRNPYVWTGSVSGTYELARGTDPSVAIKAFQAVMKDKVLRTRAAPRPRPTGGVAVPAGKPGVFPVTLSYTDPDAYAPVQVVRCRFTYLITAVDVNGILSNSGIWKPVTGSSWPSWSASLANILGPRGAAGLRFDPGDELILSLCGGQDERTLSTDTREPGERSLDSVIGAVPPPSPEASWLHWESGIRAEADERCLVSATLPAEPVKLEERTTTAPAPDPFGRPAGTLSNEAPPSIWPRLTEPQKTGDKVKADTAGKPVVYLWFTGRATRVYYPIDVPTIEAVGGVTLTPAGRLDKGEGFWTGVVGQVGGWDVWAARWRLRLAITDGIDPEQNQFPARPKKQTGAWSGSGPAGFGAVLQVPPGVDDLGGPFGLDPNLYKPAEGHSTDGLPLPPPAFN